MPTAKTLAAGQLSESQIFLCVQSNPSTWLGTRIAALAAGYQLYRPLKFEVEYVPQVPVTYAGNVIYGTLFSQGRDPENLQQSLASSNGGGITPCYTRARSKVSLSARFLPQQLFRVKGNIAQQECNPFRWVATFSGVNPEGPNTTCPGWVMVRWRYEFSNGVGSSGESTSVISQTPATSLTEVEQHLLRHALRAELALNPFFGTVLGILKQAGIELLRNIAVLVLESTEGRSTTSDRTSFGPGSMLRVTPPAKTTQGPLADDEGLTEVRDGSGSSWLLPDDTPVVIYQQGTPVSVSAPAPVPVTVSRISVRIKYKGVNAVVNLTEYPELQKFGTPTPETVSGLQFSPVVSGDTTLNTNCVFMVSSDTADQSPVEFWWRITYSDATMQDLNVTSAAWYGGLTNILTIGVNLADGAKFSWQQ